eukprot:PhM_4_TR2165/c0_g1_i1/m.63486
MASRLGIGRSRGGQPRIYYQWMKPGSYTRRRFEKMQNPYVDFDNGTSIYYRDLRQPSEAKFLEADAYGPKGKDASIDLYNEYKVVPDIYPEGFQWKHRLNTEYNQWRSNTWWSPQVIPEEHRGRLLCNFFVNVISVGARPIVFSPFDRRHWSYVALYVGTGKGMAGFGQGVAPSMIEAKREATRNAFENLIAVNLEDEGFEYPMRFNFEGTRILIYPSSKMACAARVADVMCAFGFQHGGMKVGHRGRSNNWNTGRYFSSVFQAIAQYRTLTEVAHSRGKLASSLLYNYYPYLEELRRRKGMMAQHPHNKEKVLHPNRVVDNRMPDHLKKGYYDDVYWRDFFAGQRDRLNDPRLGLRGDEQRARLTINPQHKPATQNRRTLNDVLQKMGKSISDLQALEVRNPHLDKPLSEHWAANYTST